MTQIVAEPDQHRLSIGEVARRTGLSVHALRFYEREGLLVGPVQRTAGGHRTYSPQEVGWLEVCTRLRTSGMPLADIRRYAELVAAGSSESERYELLRRHQSKVRGQLAELTACLDVIDHKVAVYARHLAAGSADSLWRDGPSCR